MNGWVIFLGAAPAVVAVGVLAARPRAAPAAPRPVVVTEDETFAMVRVSDLGLAQPCRLTLGAQMFTAEGPPPLRQSIAYRLLTSAQAEGDRLRLTWRRENALDAELVLRPTEPHPELRAGLARELARRIEARRTTA